MIGTLWAEWISDYLTFLQAGGAPYTTVRTRRQQLTRIARGLIDAGVTDPRETTETHLIDFFAGRNWAASTRRGHRQAARGFFAFAVKMGYTTSDPAAEIPSVKMPPPTPRPTADSVYETALAAAGPREWLMLRLAAELGMRRAEVAQTHSDDLIEDLTGWSIITHGKGRRDRVIPLPDDLARELRRRGAGFYFPGNRDGHLSAEYVGKLLARLLPVGTMHGLRHRFASKAYAVDHDIFAVQDLLGHASPATTRNYVHIPDNRLRELVNAVNS